MRKWLGFVRFRSEEEADAVLAGAEIVEEALVRGRRHKEGRHSEATMKINKWYCRFLENDLHYVVNCNSHAQRQHER